ncbi:HNH endonuclease signature motif containing protein [Altererythrobacter fulvus]|uniref:HNH endonuclease n=1 Tax=Caenibius fulvus TaxID=2126012 RepID=UPI00301819BF
MVAYEGRCAISGCDVREVLEAAHIMPYLGEETNDVRNGLLLRADLHTLFDLGLLKIGPDYKISAEAHIVEEFNLPAELKHLPAEEQFRPSTKALALKWE